MSLPRLIFDNFKKGDLLYGLESERAKYRPALRRAINDPKYPITVDDLNNKVLVFAKPKGKWSEEGEAAALSYLNNPRDSGLSSQEEVVLYTNHLKILKNTSYSKLNIQRNDFPDNKKDLSKTARSIIRICKLVIFEYPKEKKCTIHFLLDKINLRHVIDREYSQSHSPDHRSVKRDANILFDSYTSAELRFILKKYDAILEEKVSLKFYQNKEEIEFLDWILGQPKETYEALVRYANRKKLTTFLELLQSKVDELEDNLEMESKSEEVSDSDLSVSSEESLFSPVSYQQISSTPAQILVGQSGPGQGVFHLADSRSSLSQKASNEGFFSRRSIF
jgi:hypothetical protein